MTEQTIRVPGLDDDTNVLVNASLKRLKDKTRRNRTRQKHYDAKRMVQQVSSILPPQYANLSLVLGWTAKGVDLLARRCNVVGVSCPGVDLDALGAGELWADNAFQSQSNQGITSALIHAATLVTTTAGEVDEPDIVIQFHNALDATGFWNSRTHRLDSAFVVTDRREEYVTGFTLHEPDLVTTARFESGRWSIEASEPHSYGMTADVMPYRPRLGRPFGSSRITRPAMGIQDAAVRELLRLEGHMDIYSYPDLWLLGADLGIFMNSDGTPMSRHEVMMGRIKGIPDDENSKTNPRADVKQFAASSPEPHLAALNAHAKLFAREMSLPDSSVAITDVSNPTSAEAYDASQYELIAEAEGATDDWSPALGRAFARGLAMLNNDPGMTDDLKDLTPKWRNPRFLTRAAEADAGVKQLTAVPWLADTEVGLELLGLTEDQQARAMADKERAQAQSLAAQIIAAARTPQPVVEPASTEA